MYRSCISKYRKGETRIKSGWEALFKAETLVMQEAVIAPLFIKANANLITEGVEGIEFHPVALNRVYKSAVIK